MFDGLEIESETEAAAITRAIRANPNAWSPRDLDPAPVQVGEEFMLEPCVPKSWPPRTEERPCPFVELWPENREAARLAFAALPEHTRPLLPAFVEAMTAELPPEQARAAVLRAMQVLHSDPILEHLRRGLEGGD